MPPAVLPRFEPETGGAPLAPPHIAIARSMPVEAAGEDGARRDEAMREACRLSRDIASAMFDVPIEEIGRANRSQSDTCHARHVAMYLAHVVFQVPLSQIAGAFGRDRTSVAYAIRRVEDRRDEAGFDALVTRLERLAARCRALLTAGAAVLKGGC